jgi:uncharacterized protein (TIGR00369 family)
MPQFTPKDPTYAERVRSSFERQQVMHTIGATLLTVEPGLVEISLPYRADLTQQHGFLHAGVVSTVVDSACGYAALSLMPAQTGVLSIEYKVNLLAPARGSRFLARGRVLRAGGTVIVCTGDVLAYPNDLNDPALTAEPTLCATMLATMLVVRNRPDVLD